MPQRELGAAKPKSHTDGHKVYVNAVEDAFGADVDYAILTKVYGAAQENETRYSPAKILSSNTEVIKGNTNPKYISTSQGGLTRDALPCDVFPSAATCAVPRASTRGWWSWDL
ncbi:MAG: hypothetical protein H0W53_19750 [Acidobacteria bacterium]|nr:hypothetical protein [Acidobacteriota bacterium]